MSSCWSYSASSQPYPFPAWPASFLFQFLLWFWSPISRHLLSVFSWRLLLSLSSPQFAHGESTGTAIAYAGAPRFAPRTQNELKVKIFLKYFLVGCSWRLRRCPWLILNIPQIYTLIDLLSSSIIFPLIDLASSLR